MFLALFALPAKADPITPTATPMAPVYYLNTLTTSFVPMFMIASEYDPVVPRHQLDDMLCALESKGISRSLYQVMLLSYSDLHSFNYWQSCDQLPLDVN